MQMFPGDTPTAIGGNERKIAIACNSYCADDPKGSWPTRYAVLDRVVQGRPRQQLLKVRWHPEIQNPLLYVRPIPKVTSRQPVLLSDPACDSKGWSMVCYGDGHVGTIANADKARAV